MDGARTGSAGEETTRAGALRVAQVCCGAPDPISDISEQLGPGPFELVCLFASPKADFAALNHAAIKACLEHVAGVDIRHDACPLDVIMHTRLPDRTTPSIDVALEAKTVHDPGRGGCFRGPHPSSDAPPGPHCIDCLTYTAHVPHSQPGFRSAQIP